MIDLHTHTNQSDGTLSPAELIQEASRIGLEALAITDHDTFAGYDQAAEHAAQTQLELICGIELSTKYRGRSVHLLGYFLKRAPNAEFRDWVESLGESRRQRNLALIDELRAKGVKITFDEVARRAGKIVGRPHFAAVLMEKGHVTSTQQAFDEYLDESTCSVKRAEPEFEDAVHRIAAAGGLPVLPHPGRVREESLEESLEDMRGCGLRGIEVYHSDHSASDCTRYDFLARKLGLGISGGSDFHGAAKPAISLGTGIEGNLNIPHSILDQLRRILDE